VAGYSGTPLPRKLGIRAGHRVAFPGAPEGFAAKLGELPDDVRVKRVARGPLDLIVSFCPDRSTLAARFARHRDALVADGSLWIAWPKQASGVPTDLDRAGVFAIGHAHGLVDVKVAAIDATWSGLKFVRQLEDR
jgi:hypothetical protein